MACPNKLTTRKGPFGKRDSRAVTGVDEEAVRELQLRSMYFRLETSLSMLRKLIYLVQSKYGEG